MQNDPAVLYSFGLFVLYILLPLIPAVLIFWMFPDTKVAVSGPLQGLTVRASGAFAGYVIAVALGYVPYQSVRTQIGEIRTYAYEGVIDLGVGAPPIIRSTDEFYSRPELSGDGGPPTMNLQFVVLTHQPLNKPTPIQLEYWPKLENGMGSLPESTSIQMEIAPMESAPQRFKLQTTPKGPKLVKVASARAIAPGGINAAPLSAGFPGLDWFIRPPGTPMREHDGNPEYPAPLGFQGPTSNRCATPTFYCTLPVFGRLGAPCWCATPYGPVGGVIR